MTYDNFETLYNALDGAHVFQGYGKLYRVGADEIDESFIEKYIPGYLKFSLPQDPQTIISVRKRLAEVIEYPRVQKEKRQTAYLSNTLLLSLCFVQKIQSFVQTFRKHLDVFPKPSLHFGKICPLSFKNSLSND